MFLTYAFMFAVCLVALPSASPSIYDPIHYFNNYVVEWIIDQYLLTSHGYIDLPSLNNTKEGKLGLMAYWIDCGKNKTEFCILSSYSSRAEALSKNPRMGTVTMYQKYMRAVYEENNSSHLTTPGKLEFLFKEIQFRVTYTLNITEDECIINYLNTKVTADIMGVITKGKYIRLDVDDEKPYDDTFDDTIDDILEVARLDVEKKAKNVMDVPFNCSLYDPAHPIVSEPIPDNLTDQEAVFRGKYQLPIKLPTWG